jgi:hypothetical protein
MGQQIDVEGAVKELARGPRGGNVDNPATTPNWRRKEFNPLNGNGLHRADGWVDTTERGIKNEQPWHRMAAYMLLAGRTNSEVAMAASVTPQHVSQLRGQRWFQELLGTLANNEGDEIMGVLKAEGLASVEKMVYLRDHAECERVQYAAAKDLTEMVNGKAVQRTLSVSAHTTFESPKEEYESLQNELEQLRQSRQ